MRNDSGTSRPSDFRQREQIRKAGAGVRMLVDAGPGTGKTEMAAVRLANLARTGILPGQILVLSFSRSAVRNLSERVARLGNINDAALEELRHLSIRTFDSWAFRILRLIGHPVSTLLARTHDENIETLTKLIGDGRTERIRTLIGEQRHLIVDEFQDLPGVRGELVLALLNLLSPPRRKGVGFTILGDPAQAIYGFAANTSDRKYPTPAEYWQRVRDAYDGELEVLTLNHNFRSDRPLANLASSLRKVLLSQISDDEKLRIVQKEVSNLPSPSQPISPSWLDDGESGSRAILTRTNGESLRVLTQLFGRQVFGGATPVRLRAGSHASLSPAWVAAMLGPLKSPDLLRSQFGRIYDHVIGQWDELTRHSLGLPDEAILWARLCSASGTSEDATGIRISDLRSRLHWPDAFPDDQDSGQDGLLVTTIHQSKGLEFDIVTVLQTSRTGEVNVGGEGPNPMSVEEEANVNYVAVTRAGRELNRLSRQDLGAVPTRRTLSGGRERLWNWRNNWMNVEVGLRGDLDPFGFVDPELHGGIESVSTVQGHLLRGVRTLQGHKVMLLKRLYDRKALWNIHLQTADGPGLLVGRTAHQLTRDLLDMLHSRGFSLPIRIYNLRIANVGTVTSEGEFPLEEPYRTSRLWLGVSLFGTGDFKTIRRKK